MKITIAASALMLLLSHAAAGQETKREPPDRAAERFTVFVYAAEGAEAGGKEKIEKVTDEVRKKIKDKDKWFVISSDREEAEITVEILAHRVDAQPMTTVERQVSVDTWSDRSHRLRVELIEKDEFIEQHTIHARAQGPGFVNDMMGALQRRKEAGKLKDAVPRQNLSAHEIRDLRAAVASSEELTHCLRSSRKNDILRSHVPLAHLPRFTRRPWRPDDMPPPSRPCDREFGAPAASDCAQDGAPPTDAR